jgi:hypothetical protein
VDIVRDCADQIEGRMRLVRIVRFGLGLAAVGGAVVGMSGAALAADGPAPASPQSAPATVSPLSPAPQVSAVPAPANDTDETSTDATSLQTRVSGAPGDVSSGDSAKVDPKKQDRSDAAVPAASDSAKSLKASTQDVDVPVVGDSPATTDSMAPVVVKRTLESNPSIIVFHTAFMPIQPVITSGPPTETGDLAASLPTASVAVKAPMPAKAKSNGALGKLRAVLAGVVVPQLFVPHAVAALRGSLETISLLPSLMLGSIFLFSYGLWLRRGGFVNAARSDAPTDSFTSTLFATPHVLDYVTMPPRRHSPILMVAESKIHTQIQFATLSERRICI